MNNHVVFDYKQIELREVVMADIHTLPFSLNSEPLMASDCIITICHNGYARFQYEMQPVEYKKHDLAVVLPNQIVNKGYCSDDYSITIIIIAQSFFEELINRDSLQGYLKYKNNPNFHLSDEQYTKINTILATLRLIVNSEHPKRHETLANLFDILFFAITRYRGEEKQEREESRSMRVFNTFYDLLINNYQSQHRIEWYAKKLYLTPKYLSSVIRQSTGKSAAKWISEVITLHAKRLLCSRRDMTVQQIAYDLGFKENATFCRFFKDQTGLRPSEYRKNR